MRERKTCQVWAAVEKGSNVIPRFPDMAKDKKSLHAHRDDMAVMVEVAVSDRGDFYAATVDGELKPELLGADVRDVDKAVCAAQAARFLLNNADLSEGDRAILDEYKHVWFARGKLAKMGRFFNVLAARGIEIVPVRIVAPEGYALEGDSINNGDWVESISAPEKERKVKVDASHITVIGKDGGCYDRPRDLFRDWRRVDGSPAIRFLNFLKLKSRDRSANRMLGCYCKAVDTAVTSGMRFDLGDLERIHELTGGLYFPDEQFYSDAIESGNRSAVLSFEESRKRPPFIFAGKRLHIDSVIFWRGVSVRVTSFSGDGKCLVACHQEHVQNDEHPYGKVKTERVFRITHADLESQTEIDVRLSESFSALRGKLGGLRGRSFAHARDGGGDMLCEECGRKAWGTVYGDGVKTVYEIGQVDARCGCGTYFFVKPSEETLEATLESYTLDLDDEMSLRTMESLFRLSRDPAYAKRIISLCRPLVEAASAAYEEREDEKC